MKPKLIIPETSPIPLRINEIIAAVMFALEGEINDIKTQTYLRQIVTTILGYYSREGTFAVICDETNNSSEVVRKGELHLTITMGNLDIPYVLKASN